ncbi:hypothetical protein BLNAU_8573 [Blattamonas nauphoetae]|uniref:Uncharacterized protein n=1 Tax=Blattamonas nauphoetae TaxID=2049346 RepID=A0ABQ9XYG8_9EUKA|nr:hypothetical protein BLNAU_8573 [Blattamonas nauphoetae]
MSEQLPNLCHHQTLSRPLSVHNDSRLLLKDRLQFGIVRIALIYLLLTRSDTNGYSGAVILSASLTKVSILLMDNVTIVSPELFDTSNGLYTNIKVIPHPDSSSSQQTETAAPKVHGEVPFSESPLIRDRMHCEQNTKETLSKHDKSTSKHTKASNKILITDYFTEVYSKDFEDVQLL